MDRNLSFYTLFYVGSLVLMRFCGIITKIILARAITPFEYGIIMLIVISLPAIFQLMTNFCIFDILGHAGEGRKYFGFSMAYGILATIGVGLLLFAFPVQICNFLNIPVEMWPFLFSILIIVLLSVTLSVDIMGLLRGKKNHSIAAAISAAPGLLRLGLIFLAVSVLGITDFDIIFIIFAIPPLIVLLAVILRKAKTIINSIHSIQIPSRKILIFGFSVYIIGVWLTLCQNLNKIVISHDLGIEFQAFFDVSLTLAAVITFFSSALYLISVPESTGAEDKSLLLNRPGGLGDIGRLLFAMTLFCVLILAFYAKELIVLLFSADYAPAGDYILLIAIGYVFIFIQQFSAYVNVSFYEKSTKPFVLITVISLLIFPVFSHILIGYFGFQGAYLAFIIILVLYSLATILVSQDIEPLCVLFHRVVYLIISFAAVYLVLFVGNLSLFPGIVVSSLLFGGLIFATRYLDVSIIRDLIGRTKQE
ncbi:lipopolysaccharide biosynthesis protein [Methanogenium sp. S4BF]|uniref:lipopolysaccharide biosynthesis protein n=1 Tax=Methanogenium sp. S4BF TaxID=1789226 RepID=UPI0024163956|nr:lipopolysaccharide biosynthesis protein [Methanogenium sp. S4BF]WFN35126.1 lipopolysaccharide biosynthesis protein [Methanogenium sp. S4BF]